MSSSPNLIVCSAAEVEYTQSLDWYAKRSADAANAFDAEFDNALQQIAADPRRFPRCDERHHYFLMRRFPFRIVYRIIGVEVWIIAVAHAARTPDYWANR